MLSKTSATYVIVVLAALSVICVGTTPKAHAPILPPPGYTYTLSTVPAYAQEGSTISLILTVTIPSGTVTSSFQFRFTVRDPAGTPYSSQPINVTTLPGETEFTRTISYPGQYFPVARNSLVGQYPTVVNQTLPFSQQPAAMSSFTLGVTDNPYYERTQTVNIQATGYNASESVDVTIKAQTTSTIVYSQIIPASSNGIVTTSWDTLPNSTIDNYVVTLTGTSTRKSPSDTQIFSLRAAVMTIPRISSSKSIYQRTEVMKFAFQPTYPDGSIPTTGAGILVLAGPGGKGVTLTATYDANSQTFNATYQTSATNQTGVWTASLGAHGYSDPNGNTGPGTVITSSPQLTIATLAITVTTNTSLGVGQQLNFNATVIYPDGTAPIQDSLRAYLIYSGTPQINDTVQVAYDSGLGHWVGTYTARTADTGGLWSLVLLASDTSTPANTGTATRAITIQNNSSANTAGLPLYFFAILAAIIGGVLVAAMLIFKRRRVGHASLKIDLEAVHSEAGRIESGDFFKTIKEQVQKENEEKT